MLAGEVFSIALSNSSGSAGYVHALKDLVVPQRQLIALCVDTRERHHNARETVEIVYRVFSVSSKFSRIRREQLGKGFLDNVRHVTAFFQVYPEKVNKPDGNNKPRCYILFLWRFKMLLTETPWKL